MRNLFQVVIILVMGLLLIACGQSVTATPSPIPSPTITITATATPIPSQTTTATIEATPIPTYVRPTLIPTIDPTLLPELLNNAFSIQTLDLNGYKTRRITGWDYGFGTKIWYSYCPEYVWLDANHILLYPGAGQEYGPEGIWGVINVVPQSVVLSLTNESSWLPPVPPSPRICNSVGWSPELEILIVPGTYEGEPAIFTYSFDGTKLATYPGKLGGISPSRTKIFINNDTIIDLRTNKKINLAWPLGEYEESLFSGPFWTSDETRVYGCCYFYADLAAGISHRFTTSDFLDRQGNQIDYEGLWLYRGQWVLNDSSFLVEWSYLDDGDIRYLPMLDPAKRTIVDVRRMAGISDEWTCYQTRVSPNGKYVWMAGAKGSYLIDLLTFETQYYPGQEYLNMDWSLSDNFAWALNSFQKDEANKYNILSSTDKELRPLPITPLPESEHLWHPTDNIVVYPAKDKNVLIFLDAATMSFRESPFKDQDALYKISNLAWNPNGDKLIFITEDHILWQVDYPDLENLEQIIASTNTISGAQWSPDGNSIAFVNGSDIYIVDTTVK